PVRPGVDDEEAVGGAGTRHEEASGVGDRGPSPGRTRPDNDLNRSTGSGTPAENSRIESSTDSTAPSGGIRGGESTDDESAETELEDWQNGSETDDTDEGATTADSAADEADDWSVDLSGNSPTSTGGSRSRPDSRDRTARDDTPDSADSPETVDPSHSRSDSGTTERSRTEPARTPEGDRSFATATQQALGGGTAEAGGEFDSLPTLRVLGQLQDTYVVAETDDGLVLIDQHAADERVNYERLQREFDAGMASQALASPVTLELTAREAELFASHADALGEMGFEADRRDDRTVEVTAVPAVFDATLDPELLRDSLSAFVSEGDGEAAVDDAVDDLLADLACYPSVTGNTSLTEGSVSELLSALDDCENPYACPHGRPVIVEISGEEIGERFERDYPGHGGRRQ
ncbi:DNA mismatch repair protein MutL, partial [Halolamina salina]